MERNLIHSYLLTPDGTKLKSRHRHDWVTHTDKVDGHSYMVDGGTVITRSSSKNFDKSIIKVFNDSPIEFAREHLDWGTYGKDGTQPLKYVLLKDLETDHLEELVYTYLLPSHKYLLHFKQELEYRESLNKPKRPVLPVGQYAIFFYNRNMNLLLTEVWNGNYYDGKLYSETKIIDKPKSDLDIASAKGVMVRWDTLFNVHAPKSKQDKKDELPI